LRPSPRLRPCPSLTFLLAAALGACATGKEDRGVGGGDGTPDAGSGAPDGARPDASSLPAAPDGGLVPVADAAPPDAAPPDAAPGEPDAAPCTITTINLLGNPSLDSGPGGGWLETSSAGYNLIVSQAELDELFGPGALVAHSPSYIAWLGGDYNLTDSLAQDVVIPADASNVAVRGQRWIASEESPSAPYDTLRVDIATTAGVQLELLEQWSNQDDTATWSAFNLPVSGNYQGQTVRLRFSGATDSTLNTNFFFDTLLLEVTTCQ